MPELPYHLKKNFPREGDGKSPKSVLIIFFLSILFFILGIKLPFKEVNVTKEEMLKASKIMEEAMCALKSCREAEGRLIDKNTDINETGLIGLKYSPITTSLGSLEAKRTTTDPNFAGLIVFFLKEAGVERGDTIAVGASGSFPALIVAVLSAARVMNLRTLIMCSLGASQWGANDPEFHLLHMQNCLFGIFEIKPIALSLGGIRDTGEDMDLEGRNLLVKDIKESGIPFIQESKLRLNVRERMNIYKENAGENAIKAFINIGGSWSSMGIDSDVLKLKPGIVKIKEFPPEDKRGILYEMALQKIPVIHLLYIRGLAKKYGLSWDPSLLPQPGKARIYQIIREKQTPFICLAGAYIFLVIFVFVFRKKLD